MELFTAIIAEKTDESLPYELVTLNLHVPDAGIAELLISKAEIPEPLPFVYSRSCYQKSKPTGIYKSLGTPQQQLLAFGGNRVFWYLLTGVSSYHSTGLYLS